MEVGKVIVEDIKPSNLELLDAAIFVMRAITERLTCIQADVFIQFNEANFQLILNNEIQTRDTNESIRVNMMRILGTLALNLTKSGNQQAYKMAKVIFYVALLILRILLSGFLEYCSLLAENCRNYTRLLYAGNASVGPRGNHGRDDGSIRRG